MNYRLIAVFFLMFTVCSGTALAGYDGTQYAIESNPDMGMTLGFDESKLSYPDFQYDASMTAEYSTQAPLSSQQMSLVSLDTSTSRPRSVYLRGDQMSWNDYAGISSQASPIFWAATSSGWTWSASLPLGSWSRQIIYVPMPGNLRIYETYPSGLTKTYDMGFAYPGYSSIWFYADVSGRHVSTFTVGGVPSNSITTDVIRSTIPAVKTVPRAGGYMNADQPKSRYSFNSGLAREYDNGLGSTSRYSLKSGYKDVYSSRGKAQRGVNSLGRQRDSVTYGGY
jgi:hypothetical protein